MEREDGNRKLTAPLLSTNVPAVLTEDWLRANVFPLFSRALVAERSRGEIYLANHSLGRPLDRMADDVTEGLDAWYASMDGVWEGSRWSGEIQRFRCSVATLLGLPDGVGIIPKNNSGQGLRAILSAFPQHRPINVLTTELEFDSADFIFQCAAEAGRISLTKVPAREEWSSLPFVRPSDVVEAIGPETDIVFLSHVCFLTGQVMTDIRAICDAAHAAGAVVILDVYHSLGCVPVDMIEFDVDFALGGSYKYLRGGPGAGFLAIHPRIISQDWNPLEVGWFAKQDPFAFARGDESRRASGGDRWLDSTPSILPLYQARAGLELVNTLTVAKIRACGLQQQAILAERLSECGLQAVIADEDHPTGAFLTLVRPDAPALAAKLRKVGVNPDARGASLRFGPDMCTTEADLAMAASRLIELI